MTCIRPISKWATLLGILALLTLLPAITRAEATVDFEVATESGLAPTAPQQWAQTLGRLGLGKVRIRKIRPGDKPELTEHQMPTGTHFRLLAILDHRDRLHLPGARFGRHEIARLRGHLQRLQEEGAESVHTQRGRFGLTREELDAIHQSLSRTIHVPTTGMPLVRIVRQQLGGLPVPLKVAAEVQSILQQAPPTEIELQGMTVGTALAMLLRRHTLALVPQKPRGQPLELAVLSWNADGPSWPVGWKPEQAARLIAPQMYKFLTIEIDRCTLAEALDAIGPRIGIPLWHDWLILERRQIDPGQIPVKLPRGKTYLRRAVDRVLAQARLAGEMRVDEGGHPFYWITQYGPESPRAE